ncbi:MAG: trans-sulfuration enzyme family protein [Bacteroidales bacterium]
MENNLSDILLGLGEDREHYAGAVVPPLFQTSNFAFPNTEKMREALQDEYAHSVYSRGKNPTVALLRQKLAALEGADDALVFSSGCAAITAALLSNLRAGDHMVCIRKPYSWVTYMCEHILPRYQIDVSFADEGTVAAYEALTRPETRLYYLESPNTFTFEITDIAGVAALARERNIVSVIDNSYSTPLYQQPLSWGVDLILHSASKYLAGHSDVVAGVLAGRNEIIRRIYHSEYLAFGAVIQPFEAWLMLRGLRTLPLRLEQSSRNAQLIIQAIEGHPAVRRILYPFHPSFDGFALAQKQMKNASGLFSIELNVEDPAQVIAFADHLKYFLKAVSWGGFESLVFPAYTFYRFDRPPDNQISWRIVRLYCGLEQPEVLINDVLNALNQLSHG